MKDSLKPGLEHRVTHVVDDDRAIRFMGDELRVYATPSIVEDLEYGCRDFLLQHLDEGEDSVGARVEIEHLRPTPMGFTAEHRISIEAIDGRRVRFRVEVRDGIETVARAIHDRFVVRIERLQAAIAAKLAQGSGG